jgi:hypothetical protein
VTVCPQQAIELTMDDQQSVKQAINRLGSLVDLS